MVAAVREAVCLWDPHGVADARSEILEEYDDVVDFVLRNLRAVGTIEGLEVWAGAYLDGLGIRRHPPADRAFAERVWRAWGEDSSR